MSNVAKNKLLNIESLSLLFQQLAQLESAGIPIAVAVGLIKTKDANLQKRLTHMQQLISAGASVASAGFKLGVFNHTHQTILSAAENSGKLAEIYQQLATYYANKYSRNKKIKSRLYLPAVTLLLALFIEPIPLLVNSTISVETYLGLSLGRFILIACVLFIASKLPSLFQSLFYRLQLQLPKVKGWVIRRQMNEFILMLATLLDAGVMFSEALPLAVATIKNTDLRARFDRAIRDCHSGDSVTHILSKVKGMPGVALQIIHTGEESGKLATSVHHYAKREADMINLADDALAEWLPRLFYTAVALWMSASLLGF